MKTALKVIGIIIAVILAIMISVPLFFGSKIEAIAKREVNNMLNGEFDFSSLDISLFKNFPKVSLTLNNYWVKGTDQFATDKIVDAKELTATVDIFSLFGDSFEVDKIILKDATLKAVIAENGKVNWDILKEQAETTETADSENASGNFSLKLNQVSIDNLALLFDNQAAKESINLSNLSLKLKGDLGSKHSIIELTTNIPQINYTTNNISLINNLALKAKINVDADLENNKFTLKQNEIQINAIKASIDGYVALLDDDAIDMDLKLNSEKIGFKDILSLIPAIYSNEFKSLKTDGTATLSAFAKGEYKGDKLPAFDIKLEIKEGMFKYPSLPTAVEKVNVLAEVSNPGGIADATVININPLSFSAAGNPFQLTANITNPVTDPRFSVALFGIIDLGKVKDFYPLEDMELNGLINADLKIAGQSSFIEKELYEKIKASGTVKLTNMLLNTGAYKNIQIDQSTLTFSPEYVKLSETELKYGKNAIRFDSQLYNYIGYIIHNSTIKGSLNIKSNYLNLDDFMTDEAEEDAATNDSTTTAIILPKNIDFNMSTNLKEVNLGKIRLQNVDGRIQLRNGKADMTNLSMNTMGGNIVMNGYYSTENEDTPKVNANFMMNNIKFTEAYKSLDMVKSLAPIFNALQGDFSGSMQLKTDFDKEMQPIYPSLQAAGNLKTKDLSLENIAIVQGLAKALKKEDLVNKPVKDLDLNFVIKDGRLEMKPFDFKMGDYLLSLAGTSGLDQTIDYKGKVKLPSNVSKIEGLDTVGFLIGGSFTDPKFSIDTKSMLESGGKVLENKAKDLISKELFKNQKDSANVDKNKDLQEEVKDEATKKIKDLFKKKKNK